MSEINLLFRKGKNNKLRLVIPANDGLEFVSYMHTICIHPGALSLERTISKFVFINGLQKICQDICFNCEVCIKSKARKILRPSKVPNRSFSYYPFERTYVDLVDMGQRDHNGKNLFAYVCL